MIQTVTPVTWIRSLVPWLGGAALISLAAGSAGDAGLATAFERAAVAVTIGSLLLIACQVEPAWLGAAAVALTAFSGHWGDLGVPLPLDRVLLAAAVGGALARYFRRPHPRAPVIRPAHAVLVAAALTAVVSAVWAGTLSNHDTRFALLDSFGLVPFAMFILAPLVFPGARGRAVLLGSLVVTGAYLGLTAIFETFGVDLLVWPRYILDENVGIHADRARGPFVEAAANGLALYACGAAAAVALATWRRPLARVAAAAVLLLCAASLLFTLTRSIWLASAVATVIAMLTNSRLRRLLIPAALVVSVAIAATFAFVPSFAQQARQRKADERPIWDRENLNSAGLRMIAQRPLEGFGYGASLSTSPDFLRQADDLPMTGAGVGLHNVFVKLAVELGVLGALLWGAAFFSTVGAAALRRGPPGFEHWRPALLAIAVQGLVVQNLIPGSYLFPILVMWTLAGLIAGARALQAPEACVAA